MEMMNVIGYIEDLDKVSIEIIRQGCVHVVNALNEINQNNFAVITPNTNALMDLCFVEPYKNSRDYSIANDRLVELMDLFGMEKRIRKKYINIDMKYNEIPHTVNDIFNEVTKVTSELEKAEKELSKLKEFQEYIKNIRGERVNFTTLGNLNFFSFKIGKLSKESYVKLKDNIENISSIIYEIGAIPGAQVILSLTPKMLALEVDRIMTSLNFEEIKLLDGLGGTPEDIIKSIEEKINIKKDSIKGFTDEIKRLGEKHYAFIDESYSIIKMIEKVQILNSEVACTSDFFYLAGWVPLSEKEGLQRKLAVFGDRVIAVFKPQSEVGSGIIPPTRLKNNWLVSPFEALVRMYGLPSYNETDPTLFVAISYMIMFGCMFGDVGQGFIFLIAGIILSLKFKRPNLGGILSRVGASSMVFGLLFGSVFGEENIIKPLLFYPMENITTVLMGGVVLGVVFITVGLVYSLVNAYKRKDIEEGLFGRNGLAGLVFYWIILLTALSIYGQGGTVVPVPLIVVILCMLLGLMVVKHPISNLIKGHRPLYKESMRDYYIESGFGIFETLLSMMSNTISFIRVGAFALNHVGLFIAFLTIADMLKGGAGSIAVLILGNIIVIGLEGMVVFIQGLRLEYYELFSKYYMGTGIEYSPVKLRYSALPAAQSVIVKSRNRTGNSMEKTY